LLSLQRRSASAPLSACPADASAPSLASATTAPARADTARWRPRLEAVEAGVVLGVEVGVEVVVAGVVGAGVEEVVVGVEVEAGVGVGVEAEVVAGVGVEAAVVEAAVVEADDSSTGAALELCEVGASLTSNLPCSAPTR